MVVEVSPLVASVMRISWDDAFIGKMQKVVMVIVETMQCTLVD